MAPRSTSFPLLLALALAAAPAHAADKKPEPKKPEPKKEEKKAPEKKKEGSSKHGKVRVGDDIVHQAAFYHDMYDLPCRGKTTRNGNEWPPQFECSDTPLPPTHEPTPAIVLANAPHTIDIPGDVDKQSKDVKGSESLAAERKKQIRERDGNALPKETVPLPAHFCVKGQCHNGYEGAVAAIYGAGKGMKGL